MNSGRLASRCVTFGGLAASLIANYLHSQLLDEVSVWSTFGSALPPLFLLGAVEVVLSIRWRPGAWSLITRAALVPVAGISFYISWLHMSAVVLSWGSDPIEAYLYPIMIDVAMLLSAGAMLLDEGDRSPDPEGTAAESDPLVAVPGPPADRSPDPQRTGPRTPETGADPLPRTPGPRPARLNGADRGPDPLGTGSGPGSGTGPGTPEDRGPDPQRTPSGPPVPDRADPLLDTPSTKTPSTGSSTARVAALIPIARPIVEADPGIGWKPLAAKLRDLGHAVGTSTARDLRAALPDTDDREEVPASGEGSDPLDVRPGEGLLRV